MILTYLEANNGRLPKSSLAALGAAMKAKAANGYTKVVSVILGGAESAKAAAEAAKHGADEALYVNADFLKPYLALQHEKVLWEIAKEFSPKLVLAAATSVGKDLLPRLACRLGAGMASDIVEFLPNDSHRVHYIRQPFQREPDFGVTSVNYDFAGLLTRAEEPR